MSHSLKEKRTKEEILRLLDRAIEQEENQAQRIQELEVALNACRNNADNPRAELNETALPASKIAFRIDYYRTAENSPMKGIVEHLSSRDTLSFIGDGFEEVAQFVSRYMPRNKSVTTAKKGKNAEKVTAMKLPASEETAPSPLKKEASPLLRRLIPDLFPAPLPEITTAEPLTPTTASRVRAAVFSIVEPGKHAHTSTVRKSEPFQLEIPTKELSGFQKKTCHLQLHVEALEKEDNFIISETWVPGSERRVVPSKPLILPDTGAYRITAILTVAADPRSAYYRESRLLVVH